MSCKNMSSDLENSAIEISLNNIAYLQNGTVYVGERSNITLWQYSNMDVGSNLIIHIIFKPLSSGRQYLMHNSECESQKLPSIFIEIENNPDGVVDLFVITIGLLLKENNVETFRTSTLVSIIKVTQ